MRFGMCRLARLIRGRRLDRNPLRRGSDRAETVVLAAFLAIAPFAAHAAGSWAYATSAREAQAQRAELRKVPATLLQAPSHVTSYPTAGVIPSPSTRAGGRRTGRYGPASCPPVRRDRGQRRAGVGRPGRPAGRSPPGRAQLVTRAHLAEEVAVGTLAIALIAACRLARRAPDRCRMAAWDADWLATGP